MTAAALILGGLAPAASAADLTLRRGGRVTLELVEARSAARNTLLVTSIAARPELIGCPAGVVQAPGLRVVSADEGLTDARAGCRVTLDADPVKAGIQAFPANAVLKFTLCVQGGDDPACDALWSSDPEQNADGAEHLVTTPLHPDRFPDQIFRLNWEDQSADDPQGDHDFNDMVVRVRVDGDRDGDGLWDEWETLGVDADGDGEVDLTLPGASPDHKDVFVEADWMDCAVPGSDCAAGARHSHRPPAEALRRAQEVYAAAPVSNPDGQTGIRLHIELSNALRHRRLLDLGCSGGRSFAQVKADPANFGPQNPRRLTHHYAVFGHKQADGDRGRSGCADSPGNDLLVTLADFLAAGHEPVRLHAATLLHELGHNLGLSHGGTDPVDGKPNYLSVMNHTYQRNGLPPSGALDYSRQALPALNERALREDRPPAGAAIFACPDVGARRFGAGPRIDWNCDGDTNDTGAATLDVSGDRFCVRPRQGASLRTVPQGDDQLVELALGAPKGAAHETWIADGPDRTCNTTAAQGDETLRPAGNEQPNVLAGASDWDKLAYAFQESRSFDGGSDVPPAPEIELDPARSDLKVTLVATPSPTVPAGGSLQYVSTVINDGAVDAEPVDITQTLPPELGAFTSCEVEAPRAASCETTPDGVRVHLESLANDQEVTITVVLQVPATVPAGTRLVSRVRAEASTENNCDGQPVCDNIAEATVTVTAAQDPACPAGTNIIRGTPGNDILVGTSGNDCILGGAGDDIIQGGLGNDFLVGGDGNDQIAGEQGNDVLLGGGGNDQLNGGPGDDRLDGGAGSDACQGGGGSGDRFLSCEQQAAAAASAPPR